jgi:hypothetical protein
MDRLARDISLKETLEFASAPLDAAGRSESRDEDTVAGRFELSDDAGEVVERNGAEADLVEAEEPVDENDGSAERGDGGHVVILRSKPRDKRSVPWDPASTESQGTLRLSLGLMMIDGDRDRDYFAFTFTVSTFTSLSHLI